MQNATACVYCGSVIEMHNSKLVSILLISIVISFALPDDRIQYGIDGRGNGWNYSVLIDV